MQTRILIRAVCVTAITLAACGGSDSTTPAPVPTKLTFIVQPTATVADVNISPSVQVAVQDANGTTVTSAASSITLSLDANSAGGQLSGGLTIAAVNGVAMFPQVFMNKAGTGYTLRASSGSLTPGT